MPSQRESPPEWLDGTLYPDQRPPTNLNTLEARLDFLARLCAAWDYGILPSAETVAEIKKSEWREAVQACQLLTSPAYHLIRDWHGLPELPYLGRRLAYICDDPNLAYV
jgi:hypothetical protein